MVGCGVGAILVIAPSILGEYEIRPYEPIRQNKMDGALVNALMFEE
jgi:hypothetical protein